METVIPVIIAGGTGSRLWPLSRSACPKQLLNFLSDQSLLQDTVLRCHEMISHEIPIIVYNHEYHFQIVDQIKSIGLNARFISELQAKNTAAAIAFAAFEAMNQSEDPLLFVVPADHYLSFDHEKDFIEKIKLAELFANKNCLVTFGVTPTSPNTGYGYIKAGEGLYLDKIFQVEKFVEKPQRLIAETYLKEGNYFWNSGMFFFRASSYLRELQLHAPKIYEACLISYEQRQLSLGTVQVNLATTCPSVSIDYAVMEHVESAVVIPLDAKWSDIGSWSSIFDLKNKNNDDNVIEGDVITEKSKNCYIRSSHRLVATVGLEDHVVIETRDSVLVAHKNETQEIKKIVEQLNNSNRIEASHHHLVYRPWGSYELLIDTPHYKVKKLTVKIGNSLSLQKHKHRSEHWIVVVGVATIINGDEHLVLYPSQSTYIPQGVMHRLSNFSDQDLELIEVQIGEYLGEDDIERFDDIYGRKVDLDSTPSPA